MDGVTRIAVKACTTRIGLHLCQYTIRILEAVTGTRVPTHDRPRSDVRHERARDNLPFEILSGRSLVVVPRQLRIALLSLRF